ncbi:hypothetical protein TeGR_g15155 [Tetraparma gracilis]|uniref:CNNM transmembrane domain-containing protein n=1 Tax=Tetraparma gracilis TaxID=2962635 RepID=A0ABQ6MU72_9STRA|nr:hypothetical protein TeGR_g15155 [Tetraparma gracilis]
MSVPPAVSAFLHSSGLGLCALPGSLDLSLPPCLLEESELATGSSSELATGSAMYWDLGGVVACLGTAFMAAGLTMGLLSIDPLEMAIKVKSGTPAEQRQARRIAPLLAGHHRLLVTLLLFNAAANEALPLFLDKLVPSYAAILISVTFVLFVGEIIPSAIFTGPSQLAIASSLAPFVRLIMLLSAPVTLPIARALDWMLGHGHGVTSYNRRELQALVQIQYEEAHGKRKGSTHGASPSHTVNYDEMNIISGALAMTTKKAAEVLVKWERCYCLSASTVLDEDAVDAVYAVGHSRVPVFEPNPADAGDRSRIVGYFLTRQLMVVATDSKRQLSSLVMHKPICVPPTLPLTDLLNEFQKGASGLRGGHLALVCGDPAAANDALDKNLPMPKSAGVLGLVTMEDVIEELLQEEIFDEADKFEVKAMARAKRVIKQWKKKVRAKRLDRGEDPGPFLTGSVRGSAALDAGDFVHVRDEEAGEARRGSRAEDPLIPKKAEEKRAWFGGSK